MLNMDSSPQAFTRADSSPAAASFLRWHAAAMTTERHAAGMPMDHLRRDLASRILELTGHAVTHGTIAIDAGTRKATVALGELVFQLRGTALVLLRHCVQCGGGRLASPAIEDGGTLEYARGGWEPRCAGCSMADNVKRASV